MTQEEYDKVAIDLWASVYKTVKASDNFLFAMNAKRDADEAVELLRKRFIVKVKECES